MDCSVKTFSFLFVGAVATISLGVFCVSKAQSKNQKKDKKAVLNKKEGEKNIGPSQWQLCIQSQPHGTKSHAYRSQDLLRMYNQENENNCAYICKLCNTGVMLGYRTAITHFEGRFHRSMMQDQRHELVVDEEKEILIDLTGKPSCSTCSMKIEKEKIQSHLKGLKHRFHARKAEKDSLLKRIKFEFQCTCYCNKCACQPVNLAWMGKEDAFEHLTTHNFRSEEVNHWKFTLQLIEVLSPNNFAWWYCLVHFKEMIQLLVDSALFHPIISPKCELTKTVHYIHKMSMRREAAALIELRLIKLCNHWEMKCDPGESVHRTPDLLTGKRVIIRGVLIFLDYSAIWHY